MTMEEIRNLVTTDKSYDFLRDNPHTGDSIILLGLGGSHAYGTNIATSDVDVRGISTRSASEILTNEDFEQIVKTNTDTTIYSFDKMLKLLAQCNPNTIEILGLKPEHYLILKPAGKLLLDNKDIFLSKIAINSFAGYANAQVRRLENYTVQYIEQHRREEHIKNSIENAMFHFKNMYPNATKNVSFSIGPTEKNPNETELRISLGLEDVSLREFISCINEYKTILNDYDKGGLGKRNEYARENGRLGKHMEHTLRLYYMCFDILEKGEINTFRTAEHDLLMDCRNGKYLNESNLPIPEFYELVSKLEERLKYDKLHTELPDKPDYKKIREIQEEVNRQVIFQQRSG